MIDDPSDTLAEAPVELAPEAAALGRSARRLEMAHELAEVGLTLARQADRGGGGKKKKKKQDE